MHIPDFLKSKGFKSKETQPAPMLTSMTSRITKIGNYEFSGKVLGQGHFAKVQMARHSLLKVKVAIKIISLENNESEYVLKNMKREARILSKLSHPNILVLFETFFSSKKFYLITEFVPGGDLCHFIRSHRAGKVPEKTVRPLAQQIVSAVAHLHSRGIVHRDLKLENILLDETRKHIKLIDFGLSNFCKLKDSLNTHCGSPEYAAPELYVGGRKYGPEVDIWSLGVIFYTLVVGQLPFQPWLKSNISLAEKRRHLIAETRRGLTFKHETLLSPLSCLFRSLLERMLCPKSDRRISIQDLQMHNWIYGNYLREYPILSREWHRKTFSEISTLLKMPFSDIMDKLSQYPYGQIGGIFNIKRLIEYEKLTKLRKYVPRVQAIQDNCDKNQSIDNRSISQISFSLKNVPNIVDKHPKTLSSRKDNFQGTICTAKQSAIKCRDKQGEGGGHEVKRKSFINTFNYKFRNAIMGKESKTSQTPSKNSTKTLSKPPSKTSSTVKIKSKDNMRPKHQCNLKQTTNQLERAHSNCSNTNHFPLKMQSPYNVKQTKINSLISCCKKSNSVQPKMSKSSMKNQTNKKEHTYRQTPR